MTSRFTFFSLLLAYLIPIYGYGMWANMPDSELVKYSDTIVKAHYIGSETIELDARNYHLGVLQIEDVLKGNDEEIIFIRIPSQPKGFPQRSDSLHLTKGQKGLWFLQKDPEQRGIYIINRPDRFIPKSQFKNRLPAILKLLD